MSKLTQILQALFSGNPIAQMQKKSGSAFNIFKKTLNKLQKINDMIEGHKATAIAAIEAHQSNHQILSAQQDQNNKLIVKLDEFVNPK